VLAEQYLKDHADPATVEYYLCGPPVMVQATLKLLDGLNVPKSQIAFDEF
jgi:Na+-transporting NADH:ubiquinone oxidoreductase subunit F